MGKEYRHIASLRDSKLDEETKAKLDYEESMENLFHLNKLLHLETGMKTVYHWCNAEGQNINCDIYQEKYGYKFDKRIRNHFALPCPVLCNHRDGKFTNKDGIQIFKKTEDLPIVELAKTESDFEIILHREYNNSNSPGSIQSFANWLLKDRLLPLLEKYRDSFKLKTDSETVSLANEFRKYLEGQSQDMANSTSLKGYGSNLSKDEINTLYEYVIIKKYFSCSHEDFASLLSDKQLPDSFVKPVWIKNGKRGPNKGALREFLEFSGCRREFKKTEQLELIVDIGQKPMRLASKKKDKETGEYCTSSEYLDLKRMFDLVKYPPKE